jgi:hypothetical protein
MRRTDYASAVVAALVAGLLLGTIANATESVLVAQDDASDSAYDGGDWSTGDNGGFGFGAWTIGVTGSAGTFLATSANNGNGDGPGIDTTPGPRAWGTWAESDYSGGQNSTVDGHRSMPAMLVGSTFSISMDNGWMNGTGDDGTDADVGFNLRTSGFSDRLTFYFHGGDGSYTVYDAATWRSTGVAFTEAGLRIDITLTAADTYSMDIVHLGTGTTNNMTGTLDNSGLIEDVRVFNHASKRFNGDGYESDQFFNSMSLVSPPRGAIVLIH